MRRILQVKKVKGGLARQLPEILPYWLMGLQDSNKEVMKQAVNAFNSAFPPKKRRQASVLPAAFG